MASAPCRASVKIQKVQVVGCMARIHFIGVGKKPFPMARSAILMDGKAH
jgi:hypothetical protein